MIKSKFITKKTNYDGSQLRPLFAYTDYQVKGDSIISFIGACDVSFNHMVDMEDLIVDAEIKSDQMLHFIIEIFPANLLFAIGLQRLFVSIVKDWLDENSKVLKTNQLKRKGDDLYLKKNKLSVSIASVSVVSSQIHFAMNITNEGTPVSTLSLEDLKIKPEVCAKEVMKIFCAEYNSIVEATKKVKPL